MAEERSKKHGEPIGVWKLLFKSMGRKFMLGSLFKAVWLVAVVLQVPLLDLQISLITEMIAHVQGFAFES